MTIVASATRPPTLSVWCTIHFLVLCRFRTPAIALSPKAHALAKLFHECLARFPFFSFVEMRVDPWSRKSLSVSMFSDPGGFDEETKT